MVIRWEGRKNFAIARIFVNSTIFIIDFKMVKVLIHQNLYTCMCAHFEGYNIVKSEEKCTFSSISLSKSMQLAS